MINIFYGPTSGFEKMIPDCEGNASLTKLLSDLDSKNRNLQSTGNQETTSFESDIYVENLVVSTEEYSRLSEAGINAFISFLNQANIKNMYFQNPPEIICEQLYRYFKDINVKRKKYKKISEKNVKKFNNEFSNYILGQEQCKTKITNCLYKVSKGYNNKKPLVLLLYGPAGVGKTETAKFLSRIIGEKLFRKQFSMYQNYSFADYVFGSNHNASSLARDLLARESNIILFDEFDKPSNFFYSAFYQMFDEGIFVDKNYHVYLQDSIILCTSNFLNLSDIRKSLGEPIYTRIDSFIEYRELSSEISKKLIEIKFQKLYKKLSKKEKQVINLKVDLAKLTDQAFKIKNVREIDRVIDEFIFTKITNEAFR